MRNIFIGFIIIVLPALGYSQTRKIKGEVLRNENTPVPGVAVIQLGTDNAVATDINGQFELTVDRDKDAYIFLTGLDFEIYMKYEAGETLKSVSLTDWKEIKKDNKKIVDEWKEKNTE